jgi:DNA-binding CsgD family transcriptional regulator
MITVLVDRETELAELHGLLDLARAGRGSAVLVTGPAAVGKTALVHAFAAEAAAAGAGPVLGATASHAERLRPLSVLAQLFRGPTLRRPEAALADRVLRGAMVSATTPGLPADAADQIAALVLPELEPALTGTPSILAVEDAQHADEISLRLLVRLLDRVGELPVVLILTERSPLGAGRSALDAEFGARPRARRLVLGRLTESGVGRMLAARIGEDARRQAAACHALTSGNAMLVRALIDDCRSAAGESGPVRLAPGKAFRDAVQDFLHACEPQLPDLARAVAVLDDAEATCPEVLAELSALDPGEAAHDIAALEEAGLMRAGRMHGEAVRTAVLDAIPPDERAELHARSARILHRLGAGTEAQARHLAAAGSPVPAWATSVLCEAARGRLDAEDTDTAIRYLRLAHDSARGQQRHAAIGALLGQAEWRVAPAAAARRVSDLLLAIKDGRLAGADAVALTGYLPWHGYIEEAVAVLDILEEQHAAAAESPQPGMEDLEDADDPVDPAAVRARQPRSGLDIRAARLRLACLYPQLLERFREARDEAYREGAAASPQLASARLLVGALVGDQEGDAVAAERLLREQELGPDAFPMLLSALHALTYAGHAARAGAWCRTLTAQASAGDATPVWHALFVSWQALLDLQHGELNRAVEHSTLALELVDPQDWSVCVGVPLAAAVEAHTATGEFAKAQAWLAVPVPEAVFETLGGLHYLRARGRYYLAVGRPHAALVDFERCGELTERWGVRVPVILPWQADSAEAHLALGRPERARTLLDAYLAALGPGPSRAKGIALRLLAAVQPAQRRPGLLRAAADNLRDSGDRYQLAVALADLSRAYRAYRREGLADGIAAAAHRLADQAGAASLREQLAAEAGFGRDRLAQPPEPALLALLSNAERRVTVLAALGYTNRQIAHRLKLTVSTVEQHLTSVYRKLKVPGRSELARICLDPA